MTGTVPRHQFFLAMVRFGNFIIVVEPVLVVWLLANTGYLLPKPCPAAAG